jgi:hypothetical protein
MNKYRVVLHEDEPPTWAIAVVRRSPARVESLMLFDSRVEAEVALERATKRQAAIRADERTASSLILQMAALHAAAMEQLAIADAAIGRSIARLARFQAMTNWRGKGDSGSGSPA